MTSNARKAYINITTLVGPVSGNDVDVSVHIRCSSFNDSTKICSCLCSRKIVGHFDEFLTWSFGTAVRALEASSLDGRGGQE